MARQVQDVLQTVLDRAVEDGEVAGASLLVEQQGHPRWYAQSGYRDTDKALPMGRDTICRLYSQTKPLTATAVMMLVERGLLDLDEPISALLPGFKGQQVERSQASVISNDLPTEQAEHVVAQSAEAQKLHEPQTEPVERDVTVKDLLTMTSGLSYPDGTTLAGKESATVYARIGEGLGAPKALGTVEIANQFGHTPLHFQPGRHWMYGTSADVAGAIVEVVSGQRFGDFLRTQLFEPLGMKDTAFFVPAEKQSRLATVYDNPMNPMKPANAGALHEVVTNHLGIEYAPRTDPAFQSGGAGLFSTLDDYTRFAQMLLHGGEANGERFLSPATLDFMTHSSLSLSQLRDFETWQTGYGYNCFMRTLERPSHANLVGSVGEYGWDGWLGTYFSNLPQFGVSFLVMLQLTNAGTLPVTRRLHNVVCGALSE